MTENRRLRWGVLATGRIAAAFARGVRGSRLGQLAAVGSRTVAAAQRFADEHGVARAHGSYEELLGDAEVEAVYVATPHPQHLEWAVRAAEAGKHVLCEKPVGMNLAEAETIGRAAERAGVTLMEAWMYRCHPQTERVVQLVREGVLGHVRHVQAAFSFHEPFNPASRTWNHALGGGGVLDVGGYPLSYARLIAGVAVGQPFVDPVQLRAVGVLHPQTNVDVHTAAIAQFPGGTTAELFTGVGLHQEQVVRIYGTEGWMCVPGAYVVAPDGQPTGIQVYRGAERVPEEVQIRPDRGLYAYEADVFATAALAGEREVPACTWADTLGNMRWLDAWRREIGLVYDADR